MSTGCPLHGTVDVLRNIQQHRSTPAPTTVTVPPLLMSSASLLAKPRFTFFLGLSIPRRGNMQGAMEWGIIKQPLSSSAGLSRM